MLCTTSKGISLLYSVLLVSTYVVGKGKKKSELEKEERASYHILPQPAQLCFSGLVLYFIQLYLLLLLAVQPRYQCTSPGGILLQNGSSPAPETRGVWSSLLVVGAVIS